MTWSFEEAENKQRSWKKGKIQSDFIKAEDNEFVFFIPLHQHRNGKEMEFVSCAEVHQRQYCVQANKGH